MSRSQTLFAGQLLLATVVVLSPSFSEARGRIGGPQRPDDVFVDSATRTAVFGKFSSGPPRILFDVDVPVRFRGVDETGRILRKPVDQERIYLQFGFHPQFKTITMAALSPDHAAVAFSDASSDTLPWSGYFDLKTSRAWFLARLPAESAAWSPDGRWIAFQARLESDVTKVFVVDPLLPFDRKKPILDGNFDIDRGEEGAARVTTMVWTSSSTLRVTRDHGGGSWVFDAETGAVSKE